MRASLLAASALLALPAASRAEPIDNDYFEKKVRPILAQHCVSCHGDKKQKGELRLDRKAGFTKGGESGPTITPNKLADSLLVKVVRYDHDIKMPPKGKLADADIAILTEWVKGGAPWPEDGPPPPPGKGGDFDPIARAKAHWSFAPVRRSAAPEIRNPKHEIRNEIDRFLLAALQKEGLTFAPPADKRALLRRVTFDLTGLPPTPADINAFVKDESPQAFEKVIDRLLASPQYGERWGRHWLDLVRYAESHGHEFDFDIQDAWRYRDYVVRAFNADIPYNQLLTEHIAGDLMPRPRRDPKTGANESLLATGFWWLGEAKHSPVDSRAEYADRTDNQIDVFGKAVLGLTISCARCHDHKFDAIGTRDYYGLFSVLSSSRYNRADVGDPTAALKWLDELQAVRLLLTPNGEAVLPPNTSDAVRKWQTNAVEFEKFGTGWRKRWDADGLALRPEAGDSFPHSAREARKLTGALRSPTFAIDKPFLALRVAGQGARARLILNGLQLIQSPIYGGLVHGINHGDTLSWMVFDLRMWKGQPAYLELLDDGPGWFAITDAWFADTPPPADNPRKVPLWELPATRPGDDPRIDRVRELEAKVPPPQFAPTTRDGTGGNERVFVRGNHKTLGIEAPRGTLQAFAQPEYKGTGSGRLYLAQTLTDPSNPLVARVIVNRLWKHHFGEGLVRSPDDFGVQGQPPTHPELLDWLASELANPDRKEGGDAKPWSLKRMHKLMLLSSAYQQSSKATAEQAAKAVTSDPLNKLLHRQNVKRLEAEAIRDAILAVSGRLNLQAGGPGVYPHLTEHQVGRGRPNQNGPLDGDGRRSIYLAVRRNFLNPMFTAFDYPTPFTTIGRRTVSNVPAQALVMLNNPFVVQQAELWSKKVLAVPNRTAEERVREMYVSAFGRAPTASELTDTTAFVAEAAKEYGKPDHPKAWADLAHVLLNYKEFIFVE